MHTGHAAGDERVTHGRGASFGELGRFRGRASAADEQRRPGLARTDLRYARRIMRPRVIRVCSLALVALSCQGHQPGGAADPEACRAAAPALFKRVQGQWKVGFAEYMRGQKPPEPRLIGVLEIDVCRFRFSASAGAEPGNAAKWLPFVRWPTGSVELAAATPQTGVEAGSPELWLGTLLLHLDVGVDEDAAEQPSIWKALVRERSQPGEYLYFAPDTRVDVLPWRIFRGQFHRRADEYVPSSDPDSPQRPVLPRQGP